VSQGFEIMTGTSANQAKKHPAEETVATRFNQGKMSKNNEEAMMEQVEKTSTTLLDVGECTVTVLEVEAEKEAWDDQM
jgi:pyruvate kinase